MSRRHRWGMLLWWIITVGNFILYCVVPVALACLLWWGAIKVMMWLDDSPVGNDEPRISVPKQRRR